MGFEQQKNNNGILVDIWRMKLGGYYFSIQDGPDTWKYYSPGSYSPHMVTDLEELLSMTYDDGYKSGKEGFKHELRKFLGVKGD